MTFRRITAPTATDSRTAIEGFDGRMFTVRPIENDRTGDFLTEWVGCVVGVRTSNVAEAHIVGDSRIRVTSCGLTFGAYGSCVRRAQHDGDCASAHGDRYEGRVMTGSVARYLSNAERMLLLLCRDCAGTGGWDDGGRCGTCDGYGEPDARADWDAALDERDARDRADRARAMAAHPAGKARPVKIGGQYPRNVATMATGESAEDRATLGTLWDLLHTSPWSPTY